MKNVAPIQIKYAEGDSFTLQQVEQLFLSVGWVSGQYPRHLFRALCQSSYVLTAWDGSRLVGLLRGIDDGCMTAFLHYLLVDPRYRKKGIASTMLTISKQHYRDYLYLNVMPEESRNKGFYERQGFKVMSDGVAMQLRNPDFGFCAIAENP